MRAFVGLDDQRGWRDLRLLPADAGRWVAASELAEAGEPAILCGLWLSRAPGAAAVLRNRQQAGYVTVLVPRFEGQDLQSVLGTPAQVQLVPSEALDLTWSDGRTFQVPATAAIDTPLPEGHWGRAEGRLRVLAWRPHTQAGMTVVCTPTVAARALGASPDEQLGLLERILEAAEAQSATTASVDLQSDDVPAASVEDYLLRHGDLGALALLAWWAAPGPDLDESALRRLGATLEPGDLARLNAGLPALGPTEVYETLREAGWGAHLRVLEHRPAEEP
jgi:hypothetical protein